jgi:methylated-DNA-[protein]-cysteine S-methyltransferase
MIIHTTIDTFLGPLMAVADGDELTGLYFAGEDDAPNPRPDWNRDAAAPLVSAVAAQLTEYAAGRRREFDVPLRLEGTRFQRAVWAAIRAIPFGETISYGTLAERIGSPRSVRAAGAATGRNPISVIVPCHRIVGSDGSLTGYGGGLERKRALLELEARVNGLTSRDPAGYTPLLWDDRSEAPAR